MAVQAGLPRPPHRQRSRSQRAPGESPQQRTHGAYQRHIFVYLFRNRHLPRSGHHGRKSWPVRHGVRPGCRFRESGKVAEPSFAGGGGAACDEQMGMVAGRGRIPLDVSMSTTSPAFATMIKIKGLMLTREQSVHPAFPLASIRSQFPSLSQTVAGHPAAFLDGPGGTQVPERVIDAILEYLRRDNANTGGAYATSRNTDAMLAEARGAMADFLHCGGDEVIFGPNMTSLTFAMSRAIGRELKPGDEILVTRLDHDANVSPWITMAEDRGVSVRWVEIHDEDCTLDMADLASKINQNTRLVAVGDASNAVGTINPVREI